MRITICMAVFVFLAALISGPVLAQDMFIYPNKGQSQKQLEKDKFDCYSWAKQQTGFDPMAQPTATAPPPAQEAKQGGVVRRHCRRCGQGSGHRCSRRRFIRRHEKE